MAYIKNSVNENHIIEIHIYNIYSETEVKYTIILIYQSVLKCILLYIFLLRKKIGMCF